jgi:hypothetical protein
MVIFIYPPPPPNRLSKLSASFLMPLATTVIAVPAPSVVVAVPVVPETIAAVASDTAAVASDTAAVASDTAAVASDAVLASDAAVVVDPLFTDAIVPTAYDIAQSFKGNSLYTHPRLSLIAYTALFEKDVCTWPSARLARNICVALAALNLDAPIAKGMCVGSYRHTR